MNKRISDILLTLFASGSSITLGILVIYLLVIIEKSSWYICIAFSFLPIFLGVLCLYANRNEFKLRSGSKMWTL